MYKCWKFLFLVLFQAHYKFFKGLEQEKIDNIYLCFITYYYYYYISWWLARAGMVAMATIVHHNDWYELDQKLHYWQQTSVYISSVVALQ